MDSGGSKPDPTRHEGPPQHPHAYPGEAEIAEAARSEAGQVLAKLGTRSEGLSESEAASRLEQYGPNVVVREMRRLPLTLLWSSVRNPLVVLLSALAIIALVTHSRGSATVIFVMVVLGVVLRFVQELRADRAAEKLKAMVSNTTALVRDGKQEEAPFASLVPGDIIQLGAGDMVPADARVISAKDLFVDQAALTGEALPVEKTAVPVAQGSKNVLEFGDICFLGSNVVSGSATAVAILTGRRTYLGSLAASVAGERQPTSFDRGIDRFTWLMICFIAVMVPAVFLINGFTKHNWLDAFLFATAVAVGLTPEMLPMIVTVNLSKGALMMARKKAIVRRLNAIQNFGAMDVLCTDKTGTITQGKIVLEKYLDVRGESSEKVLHYGYLNSYHHTGLRSMLDEAVLNHEDLEERLEADKKYRKIDEIPFDFVRKRMSVVVEDNTGLNILICKGAADTVVGLCDRVEVGGNAVPVEPALAAAGQELVRSLNAQGFRVIALAYKEMPGAPDEPIYYVKDEAGLVLLGFLAFLDPPKDTAAEALKHLKDLNVDLKILTGDNEIVTAYICGQVGLPAERIMLGPQIEGMSDEDLAAAAAETGVFARLVPFHKERIVRALRARGHVVGFMGDGINDAPALKAADVGISVDTAVDIAKESSDIVLLRTSLLILAQGVEEGRRVFGNIIKYIKMAASSNFGNMFSVVGASAFLPFLPMMPIQVLTNNLMYDFSQAAIPTDGVDREWLVKPRKWTVGEIRRFILYIGPISSIFDYLTYLILIAVFHAWTNPTLFQTGWFVESIFTQTLIIHVIRTNRIPFLESRASWPLALTSLAVVAAGAILTVSPLAGALGFARLPAAFWPFLAAILLSYVVLTQAVKSWFFRKFGD